jgi:hypothetical protein
LTHSEYSISPSSVITMSGVTGTLTATTENPMSQLSSCCCFFRFRRRVVFLDCRRRMTNGGKREHPTTNQTRTSKDAIASPGVQTAGRSSAIKLTTERLADSQNQSVHGCAGNARAAQSVQRTTADEPEQTGGHEGPTIHFDRPRAGTPAPRLIRFPVGPGLRLRVTPFWAECPL